MLTPELIKRLEAFLTDKKMSGRPATAEQIEEAEKILNTAFPEDYVDFITRFGGTYAGIAIHAFANSSYIGNETVIGLTESMRSSFVNGDARLTEAQQSIAFGDDGAGNPVLINPQGEVVIYYQDSDERDVLAESLGQYIEDNFEEW